MAISSLSALPETMHRAQCVPTRNCLSTGGRLNRQSPKGIRIYAHWHPSCFTLFCKLSASLEWLNCYVRKFRMPKVHQQWSVNPGRLRVRSLGVWGSQTVVPRSGYFISTFQLVCKFLYMTCHEEVGVYNSCKILHFVDRASCNDSW